MQGTVERIRVFPAKGETGKDLAEGRFVENSGLEGDFHAVGGERQISLLLAESREQITDAKETGLCFNRFNENITIRGFSSPVLKPGLHLSSGDVILEISGEMKHCHEECKLFEKGKRCSFAGQNLFARVIKSGLIRVGDRIGLLQE